MFSLDSLKVDGFSWQCALSLAFASKISYENESVVTNVATNAWGFSDVNFFDLNETQGFVAQTDEVVLVAFRGTESLGDWLSNLRLVRTKRFYGSVHGGFLGGYLIVQAQILAALAGAANKKIWLTGHSLGGALATVMAAELKDAVAIKGIHTFGQPRLGDAAVEQFFADKYPGRFFRFVNDDDLVTRVPPGFRHVGQLIHFDVQGNLQQAATEADAQAIEPPPLDEVEFLEMQREIKEVQIATRVAGAPEAAVDASVEGLFPSVSDHNLDHYIAAIRRFAGHGGVDAALEFQRVARAGLEAAEGLESVSPQRPVSDLVPVLLRVADANWQAPAGLKINSQFGAIISAQCPVDDLMLLEQDPSVVSIEASRDAGKLELVNSLPFVGGDAIHRPPLAELGDSAIVGVIDTGIDVRHEAFRDAAGKTRILAVWNQRDNTGPSPKAVDAAAFTQDYGTLYLQADIDQFIGGNPTPGALRDPQLHGTHVASIAAGRAVGTLASGMAPEAKIIVVMPNMKTSPGNPPSLGYSNSHVDALHFLKSAAKGGNALLAKGLPIAINVSLGMNAGAHDGTSTLEAAFDAISGLGRDPGFVIVKSAGNERGFGGHARVRAINGGVVDISWDSDGTFRFQDYMEAWYSLFDELEFVLVDPAGNRSAPVSAAAPEVRQTLGGNFCHLKLTERHPDNGANRLVLTIVPQAAAIQTGIWKLLVVGVNVRSGVGEVDMWVERDDSRPVRFEREVSEMTLSIPGTAATVVTVGACHAAAPLQLTDSSSFGRTWDQRPKPDLCAPGFQINAAKANAGPQDVIPLTGTSMAAPHVTGVLALALSHRHKQTGQPQHNARQLQSALIRTVKNFSFLHHEGFGYGILDALKFFETLK